MNKRIVSLVLSLVLIVSSVVSVTAAIDTTGLTSVGVPMSAEYYTGDIASISGSVFTCDSFSTSVDEYGKATTTRTKGGERYIVSRVAYNLGSKFEFTIKTHNDNQNPNASDRIVYQLGKLAVAYHAYGSGTNDNHSVMRVYYGADIASIAGSNISYNSAHANLIGESTHFGGGDYTTVIRFDNGALEVVTSDGSVFNFSTTLADTDFGAVKPAIRIKKGARIWDNGMYTTYNVNVKLDGAAVSSSIDTLDVDALVYEDIAVIKTLRQWYDTLEATEQANVTNYAELEAMEAQIPVLTAEKFNDTIGAIVIEDLKLANKPTIEGYRAQYEAFTDDQKALVTNYDNLLAAEAEILRLVILKADTDAALVVNAEILELGEITYANYLYVADARRSYETLTEQGKTLVADYSVLTDAEATVKALRKATNFRMVNELIAAIPETVTMADNDAVFNALGAYAMLSTNEKSLVTDINGVIDDAKTLVDLEIENNKLLTPKVVALEKQGTDYNGGLLPNKETGLYYKVPDGVTVYVGDTVKPNLWWTHLLYNVVYNEDGTVASYSNAGDPYNLTTNPGGNWWGGNFQPLSGGCVRNVSAGTLNLFHSNAGCHIASIEVVERPTYEYNELFDVSMNVRTMISALPKEYSKLTEDDRYLVNTANEALDALSVYDVDEVHNVRYLINAEKVLDGAIIEDEVNNEESNITGDITKDFTINSLDLLALQMHVLGIQEQIEVDRCDLNNDTVVDSADLTILMMYIVGLGTL
ncbi:MAG: dockerin type I repeat-containing protein [Acutalibacteraceae bacterium]|nr:dockerin type I repeat-containing protein [Acutalibacteraceae bacterium]